jgi:pilus assembly protein CpaF
MTTQNLKQTALSLLTKAVVASDLSTSARRALAERLLDEASEQIRQYLSPMEKEQLVTEILEEVLYPFGKLQSFMGDATVEEIMVNGCEGVFIKYRHQAVAQKASVSFENEQELFELVEKLLSGSGRRVDQAHPLVDLRLADGSRVNIVSFPLTRNGFCITIRKFPKTGPTLKELVKSKTISEEMQLFLEYAVANHFNIIVSGGTSCGKTTTTGALISAIGEKTASDRIVVIEETSEIFLPENLLNAISLETRATLFGEATPISIRDLVKNALRMRPDRIIVGEVRGAEAFDMLQAANTGHPGAISTIHANSVADTIKRLEALMLLAGFPQLPMAIITNWVYESLDLVVYQERLAGGTRRVVEIAGVVEGKILSLFEFTHGKFKKNTKNLSVYMGKIAQKRK